MPKMNISKSIVMDASAEKIHAILTDFNEWTHWSPWLIVEPGAQVKVATDRPFYEWEGKRLGKGQMEITSQTDTVIDYDLTFLKPWKSEAKVRFLLNPQGDSTKVTWEMDSSLPFFMFFMKKMMVRLIGMDYDRGLLMLKDYAEKGKVGSKLEFLGESQYPGCTYIGLKNSCSIDELGGVMKADFEKLMAFAQQHSDKLTGEWFSLYHKFDFGKNKVVYTGGIAVSEAISDLPEGMFSDKISPTKVNTVRHTGPYPLAGNAWSSIMSMQRAKEFKQNKKLPPIEFYRNNPQEVPAEELILEVSMPIF